MAWVGGSDKFALVKADAANRARVMRMPRPRSGRHRTSLFFGTSYAFAMIGERETALPPLSEVISYN